MSEALPEIRIGDREREAVDGRLQAAASDGLLTLAEYDERSGQCWAARTQSELDVLVRDLPAHRTPAVAHPTRPAARLRVLALMSESELSSPVAPGQDIDAVAVMGAVTVDLRRENLPAQVHVRATAAMGEVRVLVPPGTAVHLSGLAVMGERKVRTGPPAADGSVVHVHGNAVMGAVRVEDRPRPGGLMPASSAAAVPARPRSARRRAVTAAIAATVVLGGAVGVQQVASATDSSAFFGSGVLRVTDQSDVRVGTAFGSVKVVVPNDVHVVPSGLVVFGSIDCTAACSSTTGRRVVVHGGGAFGSIEIVTQSEDAAHR